MSKYNLWPESTKQPDTSLCLLEKKGDWRLFQLKKSYWERHFQFYDYSYHVWNVTTGEWEATTDYKKAVDLCERRINDEIV